MDVQGVAYLYKKVVSPSLNLTGSTWQRQPHWRHVNEYQKHDKFLKIGRQKSASPARSVVSCPGYLETTHHVPQTANICQDNQEQSDHLDDYEGYNFRPTTRFTTLSLPAMPLSGRYTPSPSGTSRSVPLSSSRVLAASQRPWASETFLASSQRERILDEEKKKEHCRKLKRTSEMVKHRIDKQYYMAGARIPIQSKYHVDSGELLKLRLLANRRQLAAYKSVKDTDINPRESPSGQMSTPTPGSAAKHGSVAPSGSTELQDTRDGKWAEGLSEASSVDEFDSVSVRGTRTLGSGKRAIMNNEKSQEAQCAEPRTDQELANKTDSQKENDHESQKNEGSTHDGRRAKSEADEVRSKQPEKKKNSVATKSAKKGRIRFKDDERAKADKGKRTEEEKDNEKDKKGKDESNADGSGGERRNKYMDEWLGLKPKEPEDERYKPGKPPPNRIFVSSDPEKAKKRKHKKSAVFLTEITELKLDSEDAALRPESYGIISSQQKQAFGSIFDEIDKDKNGSMTLEELKQRMRPAVTGHDIKHFLQVFDLNRDKTVDKREFTAICALNDRLAGSRTESADASLALDLENLAQNIVIFKEMFKTIDEDDDNRMDAFELLVMVSAAMETEIGADLNLAKHVLEGARDEFGFIDFIGFLSYLPFFAKLIQTILQHPLSITDIEQARERVKQKELTFKPKAKPKQPKSWEVY